MELIIQKQKNIQEDLEQKNNRQIKEIIQGMNKKQFLLCKKLFGGIDQYHFLNFHLSSMSDGEFINY